MTDKKKAPYRVAPVRGFTTNHCDRQFSTKLLRPRPWVLGQRFLGSDVTLNTCDPHLWLPSAVLSGLAIVTGKTLTGEIVHRTGPVVLIGHHRAVWEELVYAACLVYGFTPDHIIGQVCFADRAVPLFTRWCRRKGIVWASFASRFLLAQAVPGMNGHGHKMIETARNLARDAGISLELNVYPDDGNSQAQSAAPIVTSIKGAFQLTMEKNRYAVPATRTTRFNFRPVVIHRDKNGSPDDVVDVPVLARHGQ